MKTSIVSIKKLSTMYNIRPVKFMKGISKLQNFFECVQFFQIKIVNKNVQSKFNSGMKFWIFYFHNENGNKTIYQYLEFFFFLNQIDTYLTILKLNFICKLLYSVQCVLYMNEQEVEQVIDILFYTYKLWSRLAHTYDHKRKLTLFWGRTFLQISGHHLK